MVRTSPQQEDNMTIGSKAGTKRMLFTLSENEWDDLLKGMDIVKITSNKEYKKAKFTLTFKGEKR